jgi:uncharacterized membrane protein HdeD (DUF308 family)
MELSIFLAKFLGIYLLICGVFCLFRKKQLENAVKDIFSSAGLLALAGAMSLMFGLAIVIAHPVYSMNWRGVITLIGYLSIIKGIVRLWFPVHAHRMATKLMHHGFRTIFAITLLLGVYLTYSGFMAG